MSQDLHPRAEPNADGDWRPADSQRLHGPQLSPDWTLDPDYRRLRDEHERELDAHYPYWLEQRRQRFSDDFGRWREERGGKSARYEPGTVAAPR